MMRVLSPTYTLRLIIRDAYEMPNQMSGVGMAPSMPSPALGAMPAGSYKFFATQGDDTGCNAVLKAVREALRNAGVQADVYFERFEQT